MCGKDMVRRGLIEMMDRLLNPVLDVLERCMDHAATLIVTMFVLLAVLIIGGLRWVVPMFAF